MERHFWCLLPCILLLGHVHGQTITWQDDMDGYQISEEVTIGNNVYRLKATSSTNEEVSYSIESDYFELKDLTSGMVYLKRQLDFEDSQEISVTVTATAGSSNPNSRTIIVRVVDANDGYPVFEDRDDDYMASVSEDLAVGTTVFRDVVVSDSDATNNNLQITCDISVNSATDSCQLFNIIDKQVSSDQWTGDIVLRKELDFETMSTLLLSLSAFDGKNTQKKTLTVDIRDESDVAPVFQGALTASIAEDLGVGERVMQVTAIDGDANIERDIRYSLTSNPGNYFDIDDNGVITIAKELDLQDEVFSQGFVYLRVKASEVISPGVLGDDPLTTSEEEITITFAAENNHAPTFSSPTYKAELPEESSAGTALSGLEIGVTDQDQGSFGQFELSLQNYNDIFEIRPKTGSNELTASFIVKNGDSLDYEEGLREYKVIVVARETRTTERLSSTAEVTVEITDINDNAPEFAQSEYSATVAETASPGTSVITITATDRDSGINGVETVKYRLTGNGADKFKCNPNTGDVTVARCSTPGTGNCLDYEQKSSYEIYFEAWDIYGEGRMSRVKLTINLLNENDNFPTFTLDEYERYIDEGQTVPSKELRVEAQDADADSVIKYSIVRGNPEISNGQYLWKIDEDSGIITATRPVQYEDTIGDSGVFSLTVQATDGTRKVTTSAKIYVIDINNHAPKFEPDFYEFTIPEDTPAEKSIVQVTATDADSDQTKNSEIHFRISTGSGGKFNIDPDDGTIKVAPGQTFDFDDQNEYTMTIIAEDQGAPRLSSTATVVVHISDINNKAPYFPSTTTRTDVYEDEGVGAEILTMSANDADDNAVLEYSFIQPITAKDANGNEVNNGNQYDDLFSIDSSSGQVKVHQNLDRDSVATWTSVVQVVDTAGAADQTATGTLIINIKERNTGPPQFNDGWTPDNPYIRLNVDEGDSPVWILSVSDPDAIGGFQLINNPGGYLTIDEDSGVIKVARPIDYETVQQFEAAVIVTDRGQPTLTSTATLIVDVNNLNDNLPVFTKTVYETKIKENSPAGTFVVTLDGEDADLGDFGEVRYSISDSLNRFNIDPLTGRVTVANGAVLDRERGPAKIEVSAMAYDSPNNSTLRRSTFITLIVNLEDENDNRPEFNNDEYYATLVENDPVGTSIIRVTGRDADEGINAELSYHILDGNNNDNFIINKTTGIIYMNKPLEGLAGTYELELGIRDGGATSTDMDRAKVFINVLEQNNGAPEWIRPDNQTFTILENQYEGKPVDYVIAVDGDSGSNGDVTYGFIVDGQFVSETDEFSINPKRGNITAKVIFDRERRSSFEVTIAAKDSGQPSMMTTKTITIDIGDVGDNQPEFETDAKCCPIPVTKEVNEGAAIGSSIGVVQAIDADVGDNGEIIYSIYPPNDTFIIDPNTGNVTIAKPLDQGTYRLLVTAENLTPQNYYQLGAECRCNNQSSLELIITVGLSTKPSFSASVFNTCVPMDAEVGHYVYTMKASDPDTGSSNGITYGIVTQPGEDNLFIIGATNGSVYTNSPMHPYQDDYLHLHITATTSSANTNANLLVWVTEASDEVKLTFDKSVDEVEAQADQLVKAISELANWGAVCISDIQYHITDGGAVDTDKTDLYLYVVDGGSKTVLTPDQVRALIGDEFLQTFGIEFISEAYTVWDGFDIDPVLGAIIAIILLLLLALLLLCCLWCCCAACLDEDEEPLVYDPVVVAAETINPLWKQKLYEDQELSMAVPGQEGLGPKGFSIQGTYDNSAFDASGESGDVVGQTLTDGTAKLTLPGKEVTKETREETEFHVTSFTEVSPTMANGTLGHAPSQKILLNSASMDAIDAPLADSRPPTRVANATTMTDATVQYERTPMGAYEATVIGYQEPVRAARVGATLTRPTTPYASSVHAYSAFNGDVRDIDIMPLNDPLVSYDFDDGPRLNLNQGVQTGPIDDYPITGLYHTYSASIPDDRRTELSLTPSQLANSWVEEPLDGMYQGEIHLGTLRTPSVSGPPGYQTVEDARFVEYTYEDDADYVDAYPRY